MGSRWHFCPLPSILFPAAIAIVKLWMVHSCFIGSWDPLKVGGNRLSCLVLFWTKILLCSVQSEVYGQRSYLGRTMTIISGVCIGSSGGNGSSRPIESYHSQIQHVVEQRPCAVKRFWSVMKRCWNMIAMSQVDCPLSTQSTQNCPCHQMWISTTLSFSQPPKMTNG